MTFLAGYQTAANPHTNAPAQSGADAFWDDNGYSVAVAGNLGTVFLNIQAWNTATGTKVSVYQGGTLVATSATFVPADGTGLIGKAITGAISVGTVKVTVQSTGGAVDLVQDLNGSTTQAEKSLAGFDYTTQPSTLPSPDSTFFAFPWVLWLDGTVGGGSNAGKRRMMMGFG